LKGRKSNHYLTSSLKLSLCFESSFYWRNYFFFFYFKWKKVWIERPERGWRLAGTQQFQILWLVQVGETFVHLKRRHSEQRTFLDLFFYTSSKLIEIKQTALNDLIIYRSILVVLFLNKRW
jgi:hypothetical protein